LYGGKSQAFANLCDNLQKSKWSISRVVML
jgi:hypothetical protein